MEYGYARVSTVNQNLDRQISELEKRGIKENNIYTDKESGKDFNRKNYIKLIKRLKEGDVLFIKSIDRLGRNYNMILDEWRILTKEKGIDIVVIDMPLLDTRIEGKNLVGKFIADLVLQVLSFVAENERETIKQRQAEGIRMAKLRGVKFGRPPVKTPKNFENIACLYNNKEITSITAIEMSGLTRGTFYRKLKEVNNL
ncbi:MAG: recombinase family protein [Bacilli bacterium]